ncbi:hypothetical protein SEA_SYRA333_41 [Mycobacterium phage Syra333]|uniref:Uncharacterized protein n=1 Tax=Mycobacterium phage Krueger TaxID=2015820 RepID=A0A222ZMM3_9CAUD|nr:hypothetical protein I5G80_gp041 [Mycobacterium phage Krueger]ASR85542.1 hypothetical protein SEA_KRUEGER_41 [Mycobacterium phage Krueger]WNM69553.1 hypothetical protein SEA_SYRA333_41 [Mycobacterium phage Syra333]
MSARQRKPEVLPRFAFTGAAILAEARAAARRERQRLDELHTPGSPAYNLARYGCECGRRACDH